MLTFSICPGRGREQERSTLRRSFGLALRPELAPLALPNLRHCYTELDQLRERGLLVVVCYEYSAAEREGARNVQHVEGSCAELRRVLSAQLSGKIEHPPKGHVRE